MLIRFFKNNQPATLFAIPLLVAILWIPAWSKPDLIQYDSAMPLYKLLLRFLGLLPKVLLPLVAITCVSFQALYLNFLVNQFEVLSKKSYVPALFYVFLTSALGTFTGIHPVLIASTLLVFVLGKVLSLYKNESALHITFDIGMFLSLASLIYFQSIVFFILFYCALVILRPFVWREWLAPAIGFLLPYLFVGVYYFWFDRLNQFQLVVMDSLTIRESGAAFIFIKNEIPFLGITAFFVLMAFLTLAGSFFKNVIRTRSYLQILLWMLFILAAPLFIPGLTSAEYPFLLAIPLSVFISNYFLEAKKNWWLEVLFILYCVSILMIHFT